LLALRARIVLILQSSRVELAQAFWQRALVIDFQVWGKAMMKTNRILVACLVVLAIGVLAWPTFAQRRGFGGPGPQMMVGPAHYTVVMTEGHNLLVTDNGANKLYFYTTDKDKPIGSPLKLRASVDLTNVGQEEIKITEHNVEKIER